MKSKPIRSRKAASDSDATEHIDLRRPLQAVHRGLFRYPMAAQAGFAALVAEGKSYARTPEGAAWRERLLLARETGKAQLLWEILSSRTFTEYSDGALPSTLVDALSRAIRVKHLEPLLARILDRR